MDEFIQTLVIGAPNFVFAAIAILALYRRLNSQDALIALLIEKWSECEDDVEKSKIASSLGTIPSQSPGNAN